MATTQPAAGTAVRLERTYAASPEKVFEAFTKAEALSRWFGPADDTTVVVHVLEPRVGGRYRVEMRHANGTHHIVGGVYETVTPPTRLVYTWAWETMPEHGTSRVTIALEKSGTGTKLVLVHELLSTADSRERHTVGWNSCLDRLAKAV